MAEDSKAITSKKIPSEQESAKFKKRLQPIFFLTFSWTILGVCGIYGYRMWQDAPVHPSFVPMIYGCVSILMSFIIVLTLKQVAGDIKFEIPGVKLEGAGGPIVLWVICLIAISFSFKLLGGLKDSEANWKRIQTHAAHKAPEKTNTSTLSKGPDFTP
jgi:hypothetical protein